MFRLPTFFSPRMFVVPTLLLIAAIGLIGYMALRKDAYNEEIRRVMGSHVYHIITTMQNKAWDFNAKLGAVLYAPDGNAADIKLLEKDLESLIGTAEELNLYYQADLEEGEEHIEEMISLKDVLSKLESIKILLSRPPPYDLPYWRSVHDGLGLAMGRVHALGVATEQTHREEIAHVLGRLEREEKQSAFLILLVLIGGFALIIALIDAVYHYKANAERARAAEKTNAIFAAALQNTRVGVLIRDMRKVERPVVFVNNAFSRITGYSFDDVKGDSSEFLFGWNTDPASIAAFRRAVSLRETSTFELQLYRKSGQPFWSEWHLCPLMGEDGQAAYFVSLFNDNTVIRQTQEELIQAKAVAEQANAVKGNFLAMMSHEIRTPINGILGVLKLLHETHLDEEQRHFLTIAKTSSAALHGIINDILDYAKMEAGKVEIFPEAFSIHEMLSELTTFSQTLIGEKKISVTSYVADDVPDSLFADVGRVRQILLNLISNAIKFTDKGTIQIRVLAMMPAEVNGSPGQLMRFEVQDSGIGISIEGQSHLFQEFSQIERSYTRRTGGTGLGLAICRRLVQMMEGEIGVESQQGKGSKFWFLLPIQHAAALPEAALVEPKDSFSPVGPTRAYSLLLVEDNDTNRLIASRYIAKAGLLCDEACNGLQAIEKAKAKNYDIILMDVSMPEMDGLEATGCLRKLGGYNAEVPVIALTAHVMFGDRERCLAAGMNDYLNKPLDYGVMLKAFEKWLHVAMPLTSSDNPSAQSVQKASSFQPASVPKAEGREDAPLFDDAVLRLMRDDLGASVVEEVTSTFLYDSPARVKELNTESLETIRDGAHTLKSSSASCGLMRFSWLMADLEAAAGNGNVTKVGNLVPLANDIYAISRARLEKERGCFIV